MYNGQKFFACGAQRLETVGLRASQPVSKKLGANPALSFQRLASKAQLLTVYDAWVHIPYTDVNTDSAEGVLCGVPENLHQRRGNKAVIVIAYS